MKVKHYFANIAVWLDEGGNVLLGGNPHETISERAALARSKGKHWGCILCTLLGVIVRGHCDRTYRELTTAPINEYADL